MDWRTSPGYSTPATCSRIWHSLSSWCCPTALWLFACSCSGGPVEKNRYETRARIMHTVSILHVLFTINYFHTTLNTNYYYMVWLRCPKVWDASGIVHNLIIWRRRRSTAESRQPNTDVWHNFHSLSLKLFKVLRGKAHLQLQKPLM